MAIELKNPLEAVYYVETSLPDYANPLAIRPLVTGNEIAWEDTSSLRQFMITSIQTMPDDLKESPPKIIEVTTHNCTFTLKLLTLKLYNEKVKAHVAGQLSFDSEADLISYYLNTNFCVY